MSAFTVYSDNLKRSVRETLSSNLLKLERLSELVMVVQLRPKEGTNRPKIANLREWARRT
jgi:hypothetical protein